MTEQEAIDTVAEAERAAKLLIMFLSRMGSPQMSVTALGLAAGTLFGTLEYEPGTNVEELMQDWQTAVKIQYDHTREKVAAFESKAD